MARVALTLAMVVLATPAAHAAVSFAPPRVAHLLPSRLSTDPAGIALGDFRRGGPLEVGTNLASDRSDVAILAGSPSGLLRETARTRSAFRGSVTTSSPGTSRGTGVLTS